jgi:hypothetical protein
MPRLRKPPKEEIQIIADDPPPNESVVIDIDDIEGEVEVQLTQQDEPRATDTQQPVDDDPIKRALEATQRAEELQRSLAEAQRQRDELAQQARSRDEEIARERASAEDAQYNSVLTAIAAEQAQLEKAEADYAAFASAGDWAAAGRSQRVMATASARIDRLEDNKQAFETRREDVKRNPPAPRTQTLSQTAEQQIAALAVPDNAKSGLRGHPDLISDPVKRERLSNAHGYLTRNKGVAEYSQAYFDALDTEFGFKTPATTEPTVRRSMPVSAPVSREPPTPSGQRSTTGNRVTLSPEEREIARNSFGPIKGEKGEYIDMTNEQKERLYAMNKAKLHRQRATGQYRHTTEQTG